MTNEYGVKHGDCRDLLKDIPDNSVDSFVTDPPYEFEFMNQRWDGTGIAFDVDVWREVFRAIKPGGHIVVFGAERRIHRVASAVEDAGFLIRHLGCWVSAQSFPKSLDLSKAIDQKLGATRADPDTPETGEAKLWEGWGTALKTQEPFVLAKKPIEGTFAENLMKWGTGGLFIEGCRLPFATFEDDLSSDSKGRWPSTVICSDEDVEGPVQGVAVYGDGSSSGDGSRILSRSGIGYGSTSEGGNQLISGDGGASLDGVLGPYTRHFRIGNSADEALHIQAVPEEALAAIVETMVICPKAGAGERDMGLDDFDHRWVDPTRKEGSAGRNNPRAGAGRQTKRKNIHPTVKPVSLMRHLVRLVTPRGGLVVDPFCGAGSTGVAAAWEGVRFLGFELEDSEECPYVRIARSRRKYALNLPKTPEITHRVAKPKGVNPDQTALDFLD